MMTTTAQKSSRKYFLNVSDLSVEYRVGRQLIRALDGVTFNMPAQGTSLGLVGESGSGKSTLAMSLMNVIEPPGKISGGTIDFEGEDVLSMSGSELRRHRWQKVSMVYQSAMDSLNPVRPVIDPLVEVLRFHRKISKGEATEIALKSISDVGIPTERAYDYPFELSGGMRQRIVIALALVLSPKLLIADEPTSALDVVTQRQILNLIKTNVDQRGLSLIFITHEIALLTGLVDNIAVMYKGEIVEQGPTEELLANPKHPYTEMLVGSLLRAGVSLSSSDSESGQRATASRAFAAYSRNACKYAARCKYAFDRCGVEKPLLREIEDGRLVSCHKYS